MTLKKHEKDEKTLDILDIIETEKKLRHDMAVHIRALFSEPRSSEFSVNVSTNLEAFNIASQIKKFTSNEGKSAAEHFSHLIFNLFYYSDPLNLNKSITQIDDIEFIKSQEIQNTQSIWIKFHNHSDFVFFPYTLSGFSSDEMSLHDLVIFYDIISDLHEVN